MIKGRSYKIWSSVKQARSRKWPMKTGVLPPLFPGLSVHTASCSMFFLKELEHSITLPPEHLGPNLPNLLQQTLLAQVEGHCTGRHGYIIAVLGHERLGKGMVQDGSGTGSVEFKIKYRAIVLKPFKNEVVDAVVVTVNKMGFFAEVGPLNIFVSNHLIPTDFKFEPNSMPPCYLSEEQSLRIAPGDLVRIKIVGTRVDAAEIFAIGTIKEDYLGLVG